MSFDIIRSPNTALIVLFYLYAIFFALLVWEVMTIFRHNGILIGHLSDAFNYLTRFRIWTLNHRGIYTATVATVIISFLLGVIYWAETGHYYFYGVEPMFDSVPEFLLWMSVLIVSGFGQGDLPKSFLGAVVAGGMPIFILGSIFGIVRYTSEQGHELILEKLSKGDISSYRVIVFNYQPEYEKFVHTLLEDTECFVVVFSAPEYVQEAEGLKDNFAETSEKRFRISVRERTYSAEILFENLDLLEASEIYILSDMTSETEFKNSQLVLQLNDEVKRDDRIQHGLRTPPQTVWILRDRKRERITTRLDSDEFVENFHSIHFYHDSSEAILANLSRTTESLDTYFGLNGHEDQPAWFDGETLERFRFAESDVTDAEIDAVREFRNLPDGGLATGPTPTERPTGVSPHRSAARNADAALQRGEGTDDASPVSFYGLIANTGEHDVVVDAKTAVLNDATSSPRRSLYVVHESISERPSRWSGTREKSTSTRTSDTDTDSVAIDVDPSAELIIINTNENVRHLLTRLESTFADAAAAATPDVTVYYTGDVSANDVSLPVTYVEYESNAHLLERLFSDRDGPGRLSPGDNVLLFLDYATAEPHIESIKFLDQLDDRLADPETVDHDEIFLCVESRQGKYGQIYDQISADKQIDTFQTQELFLNNLVLLRNSPALRSLELNGTLTSQMAFDWAVQTAYRLRHFDVQPVGRTTRRGPGTSGEASTGWSNDPDLQPPDESSVQPFAGFTIDSGNLDDGIPRIEMQRHHDAATDSVEYLLYVPRL